MKHPHVWKYFYFEMVKAQSNIPEWNLIMGEAYKFSEFFNTTPRTDKACLSSISMDKTLCLNKATHLTNTLQKPYISGCFDSEGKEEGIRIQKCVEDYVLHITKLVESSNKKLAATPILSGSVAEGTKVGFPDEYDFILHLHELQDEFDKSEEPLEYPTHLGQSFDSVTIFAEYNDAFIKQVREHKNINNFHHLSSQIQTSNIKPFSITLHWNGNFFKDLRVNIDIVPAFKITYQKAQKRLLHVGKESANNQIFVVTKDDQYDLSHLRLSHSLHERDLLQNLPMHAKNGYRLAKAVRHAEVWPGVQLPDMTVASVDKYITTYMIKTCLLFTVTECDHNELEDKEWLSPLSIKWAIKIFEQMKYFMEIFDGKIPNYFHKFVDVCSSYQIAHPHEGAMQQYNKRKQIITLTFINYILQLLNDILQQRLQDRCLIQ